MTSVHLSQPAQGDLYPLNSRTSSATLYATRLSCNSLDSAADPADMIIAQGLLRVDGPQIPSRHSSFIHPIHGLEKTTFQGNDLQLKFNAKYKARHSRQGISSNTWTSSSGDGAEDGGYEDRALFIQEYNRLAMKYGVQPIVPDEYVTANVEKVTLTAKQGSWIMRKLLRRTSSIQPSKSRSDKHIRHKRSISDLSMRMNLKKDALKDKDLEELVRLCGASALYLPAEYAPATLAVPTCFRATAQYLVQHDSRGIFRIPGSHSTVNALYNHYATQDEKGEVINGTVRCPTLPEHIPCNVHDVASAFKKFLAGLPGGILGRTWLFDAFLSIYTQLDATAELTRTKQSKVRARLIALAVACVGLRYQRELICAVIGLLSMIGRAAETTPREDENGRPLPTSDLMGYKALGIVFGPLLIGELLDSHDLYPSGSHGSLTFAQRSPSKSSKGKQRKTKTTEDSSILAQNTDKIKIINSITEMLITHWRDVVRHMRSLGALGPGKEHHSQPEGKRRAFLRPSVSETFVLRKPPEWNMEKTSVQQMDWNQSPTPPSRNEQKSLSPPEQGHGDLRQEGLSIRKRRPRPRPMTSQMLSNARSMSILSPTKEESFIGNRYERLPLEYNNSIREWDQTTLRGGARKPAQSTQTFHTATSEPTSKADRGYSLPADSNPGSELVQKGLIHAESIEKYDLEHFNHASLCAEQESLTSRITSLKENIAEGPVSYGVDAAKKPYIAVGVPSDSPHYSEIKKCDHTLSKEPRAVASSPQRSKDNQVEQDTSVHAPSDVVLRRLGGIVTNDPCGQPPSGFRVLLQDAKIDQIERIRRPRVGLSSFRSFRSHTTDPLARVSHEEDLASLASLAKVIGSQDDGVTFNSPPNSKPIRHPFTHINAVRDQNTTSQHTVLEITDVEHGPDVKKMVNEKETKPKSIQKSPFGRDKVCVTPQRDATDSSVQDHRVASSVRALAAKFDNHNTSVSLPPSTKKTPDTRRIYGHRLESSFVSSYTVNASPIPRSQNSNRSDRSLQAIRNPYPARRYDSPSPEKSRDNASSLAPKRLFAVAAPQDNTTTPRQVAQSHLPFRSPRSDSTLAQNWRNKIAVTQVSSTLQTTGDGPADMAMSRTVSLGTASLGPEPAALHEITQFGRPSTPQFSRSLSASEYMSANRGHDDAVAHGVSKITIAGKHQNNRGTSMLYSQIQQLQRQLKAKTGEVEHLRRQFLTKESLNDFGTLRDQLRQAKKDLEFWRNRAEVAEKRLEAPSCLVPREIVKVVACCNAPDNQNLERGDARDGDRQDARLIERDTQTAHERPRERQDIDELPGSEGTVRRSSLKPLIIFNDGMDCYGNENR